MDLPSFISTKPARSFAGQWPPTWRTLHVARPCYNIYLNHFFRRRDVYLNAGSSTIRPQPPWNPPLPASWTECPTSTSTPISVSTSTTNLDHNALRRLELLALDTEFTHVRLPDGSRQSHATWVCLVDRFGGVPLKTHIALPPEVDQDNSSLSPGSRTVGGVPRSALSNAPPLAQVRTDILALLRRGSCRVLIGHGLTKDLRALGIGERTVGTLRKRNGVRLYDTMSFSKFRGPGGTARSLSRLVAECLDGRRIQEGGRRHDPEEDARAVMDLYVRYVDYSYMVEYQTAQIMEEHLRRAGDGQTVRGRDESGMGDGVFEDGIEDVAGDAEEAEVVDDATSAWRGIG